MKFKNILTMLLVCFILSQTLYCSEESLNESLRKIAAEMAAEFKTDSNVIIVASFFKALVEENEMGNIISEELAGSIVVSHPCNVVNPYTIIGDALIIVCKLWWAEMPK